VPLRLPEEKLVQQELLVMVRKAQRLAKQPEWSVVAKESVESVANSWPLSLPVLLDLLHGRLSAEPDYNMLTACFSFLFNLLLCFPVLFSARASCHSMLKSGYQLL
jgi:hypothetical protein